jgi:predicted flap endonuclease-1-like 5' DNA nuclease
MICSPVFTSIDLLSTSLFQENQPSSTSGWLWFIIVLAIILIVAWRLISNRRREEFPTTHHAEEIHPPEVETSIVTIETRATAPEVPASPPDDLVVIEGIGPKISSVLQANGITTFAQLATTEPSQLQEILLKEGLRLADPTTWPAQARLAASGDWDGLSILQARLKGGRQA